MLKTGNWEVATQANRLKRDAVHFKGWRIGLIDTPPGRPSPHAYVVEQQAGFVLQAHWHVQHQFQIVATGAGAIGKHAVRPLAVHYASPESPYGPITTGPEGVSYLTLRAMADDGAQFMPESRTLMRAGLAKYATTVQLDLAGADDGAVAAARSVAEVARADDGMRAWNVLLPAGDTLRGDALPGSAARYYYVAAGSMEAGGETLPARSVCFVHDEPEFGLRAGPRGAQVLVLQYPEAALQGKITDKPFAPKTPTAGPTA